MNMNNSPFMDAEQVAVYLNLYVVDKDEKSPTFGQKVPNISRVNNLRREGKLKATQISEREIQFLKSDVDAFLKAQRSEPISSQGDTKTDNLNTDDKLAKINTDIETMEKSKILHQKTLEYQAMRAGFKTAEEYQQALDNLKVREDGLKTREISLNEQEQTIKAREIVIKDREDTIEAVCNEKLTECQNTCDNMIEDTKKQCEQMVAKRKEEVKKQENSEFENMEQALHEIEDINLTIHEYGFDEYGEQIDVMIDRIIYCLNNNFTLLELRDDFKYTTDVINEVLETTQNRKDANKFVDFRNQIGKQVKNIMIKLHLDDRLQPPSKALMPIMPSD